jgi:hypothetical protein
MKTRNEANPNNVVLENDAITKPTSKVIMG